MKVVETVRELREQIRLARQQGKRIGFVPTMGNLHEGHMSLIDAASEQCDFVVASIFVNPLQFNNPDDLSLYPRTFAADQQHLQDRDCNLLFFPSVDEVYPAGQDLQAIVSVPDVSDGLCGASRPGHFDGVSTVVTKLFNMAQPDAAFFGEKDYQQLAVIKKMVTDLCMPIEIVPVATKREEDGLAMSSRNGYLTAQERENAVVISQVLLQVIESLRSGNKDFEQLCQQAKSQLSAQGYEPDYVQICQAQSLKPASKADTSLVVLGAAFLGKARLIDNFTVDLLS